MNNMDIGALETMVLALQQRLQDSETEISNLKRAHTHCPSCGARSLRNIRPKEKQFADLALPDAVMSILWECPDSVSIRTLRMRLLEKGYPKEKLGQYGNRLHTVVWRLSEGDSPRIKREGDEIIAIRA